MKNKSLFASVGISLVVALSAPTLVLAHTTAAGSATTANILLNSAANWTTIRSASVTISPLDLATHTCVVTASADMDHDGAQGVNNRYRFVVTSNNSNPFTNSASERILELVDNPNVDDSNALPVSTNRTFFSIRANNGINGTGTHRFRFLGRKVQANDTSANVLDSSLSVICADNTN
ncbi:MAG: hypothetical protein V3U88_13080 [Methylococcales bacterium]